VLHLAYNDLKSIEDIRPLSTLPSLSILSLIGNPFLAALNYVAFVKMLIPSLLLLDDRDASQSIIAANVYPHEEIFILRDALNKLLD
jgi:Leucine-rich repeat (LRR) protein